MSASGDATESQEPRLTQRGSLISALGAKPRESHMVGFARGSPLGLSKEGSVSPRRSLVCASVQLGGELMRSPFAGVLLVAK